MGACIKIFDWKKESLTMALGRDSTSYEILEAALDACSPGPYLSAEIGIREGGSAEMIINKIADRQLGYTHIGIDHYGQMPQVHSDTNTMVLDYTNSMRNRAIAALYTLAEEKGVNFLFQNMQDGEFFKRFPEGVPIYNNSEARVVGWYGFVFLDGPHSTELVLKETEFFAPRCVIGATMVFDDTPNFDMGPSINCLKQLGFEELVHGANKMSFIRREPA